MLEGAYRRAVAITRINAAINEARDGAIEAAENATIPKNLRRQIRKTLTESSDAWDQVVYDLAMRNLNGGRQD